MKIRTSRYNLQNPQRFAQWYHSLCEVHRCPHQCLLRLLISVSSLGIFFPYVSTASKRSIQFDLETVSPYVFAEGNNKRLRRWYQVIYSENVCSGVCQPGCKSLLAVGKSHNLWLISQTFYPDVVAILPRLFNWCLLDSWASYILVHCLLWKQSTQG